MNWSLLWVVILGFTGWIVVILCVYRSIKLEQEKNYKAIHLSAIKDGRVGKLFKSGIIEGLPVVSEAHMNNILEFLKSDEVPEGFKEDLQILKNLDLRILQGDFTAICKTLNCPAITAGEDKKLEIQGIECIDIRDLDIIGKSNIIRGERITVNYVDYGYDKARGFLEDGTIVEVLGKIPENQPVTLECIVDAVMESKFERKIWAKVVMDD
jgi:uncharacterized protein YacL